MRQILGHFWTWTDKIQISWFSRFSGFSGNIVSGDNDDENDNDDDDDDGDDDANDNDNNDDDDNGDNNDYDDERKICIHTCQSPPPPQKSNGRPFLTTPIKMAPMLIPDA